MEATADVAASATICAESKGCLLLQCVLLFVGGHRGRRGLGDVGLEGTKGVPRKPRRRFRRFPSSELPGDEKLAPRLKKKRPKENNKTLIIIQVT